MKKTIAAICVFSLIILVSACSRHVSPAAVTEPDINTPVLTAVLTAASTETPAVVPTGSITATSTLGTVTVISTNTPSNTFTHTYTQTYTSTSVSTATFTAVATATGTGTNYRVKSYTFIIDDSMLGLRRIEYDFIYAAGGAIQTGLTVATYADGLLDTTGNIIFDDKGNTISGIVNDSTGALKSSFTGIVMSDKLTEIQYYDKDGILEKREVYQNDSMGRKTRIDYYDENGVLMQSDVFEYNAAGQKTRDASYQGGIQKGATEYFYNAAGKLARNNTYMGSTLSTYTVYYFDALGFNSGIEVFSAADVPMGYGPVTCDSRGNILSVIIPKDYGSGDTSTESMVYAYNEADLPTYIKVTMENSFMGIVMTTVTEGTIEYEMY